MKSIATKLYNLDKNIILIYAFNGTGKTRLSVAYKDVSKEQNNGSHAGVYYNAYSEDLFVWDNNDDNNGTGFRLKVTPSSLNKYHQFIDEEKLNSHLAAYKPNFDYRFHNHAKSTDGIEYIQFYLKKDVDGQQTPSEKDIYEDDAPIKISRGEQQFFIWCFFLTLFDIEGWTGAGHQSKHFFIDDPVSSLDDHNIFVTVASLINLIDKHYLTRKIIVTTHHIGLFSILCDWLSKGEKANKYENSIQKYILKKENNRISLKSCRKDVFLYHLELLQILNTAVNANKLYAYHFALLRQVIENISSFLGSGQPSFVLKQIGIEDPAESMQIINALSHKRVFQYEAKELVPDNKKIFVKVFRAIMDTYHFRIMNKKDEQ